MTNHFSGRSVYNFHQICSFYTKLIVVIINVAACAVKRLSVKRLSVKKAHSKKANWLKGYQLKGYW